MFSGCEPSSRSNSEEMSSTISEAESTPYPTPVPELSPEDIPPSPLDEEDACPTPEPEDTPYPAINDYTIFNKQYSLDHAAQWLIGGKGGCYVVGFDGEFSFVQESGEGREFATLPRSSSRSYSGGTEIDAGLLALYYQSTAGFGSQDGSEHGIYFLDPRTGASYDWDAYALAHTRPASALMQGGLLTVLFNEGSEEGAITDFQIPSTLATVPVHYDGTTIQVGSVQSEIDLLAIENANALFRFNDRLAVIEAGGSVYSDVQGSVATVGVNGDLMTQTFLSGGLGLGNSVDVYGSTIATSGYNSEAPIAVLIGDTVRTINAQTVGIDFDFSPSVVLGAENLVFFNAADFSSSAVRAFVADVVRGETQPLYGIPGSLAVGFARYVSDSEDQAYCSGGGETVVFTRLSEND